MLRTEEIGHFAQYLRGKGFKPTLYQVLAAEEVLRQEFREEFGSASLVRLTTLLGPIFCSNPEEQAQFEELYLQWLRQRSHRPHFRSAIQRSEAQSSDVPETHWRMRLAFVCLLVLPVLALWFLSQDLRSRQIDGVVITESGKRPVDQATVHLGNQRLVTGPEGGFHLTVRGKDLPLELIVEKTKFVPAKIRVGERIREARGWFYLFPLDFSSRLSLGSISLVAEAPSVKPDPIPPPQEPKPESTLRIEKVSTLALPLAPWWVRLDIILLGKALAPLLVVSGWILFRLTRRPRLQRVSSRIPPALKQVQIKTSTTRILPSLSLRHMTQRLRQTRFVESAELDVARTVQHTMNQGGLFTPVFGSKREPGYVALIDRATLADHQAHLAGQLVKDLVQRYVLIRQYEFDESPTWLQRVDPLRTSANLSHGGEGGVATASEVVSLETVQAKYPDRRLLCFVDPLTCFDPLTGKLQGWVEVLEGWEERFLFTTNPHGQWGVTERILSRRGFQVIPFSLLGIHLFVHLIDQGGAAQKIQQGKNRSPLRWSERLGSRWLERHPPGQETIAKLMKELEQDLGSQGMLWLAACAAYPEIHWGLTLEWGIRLFGQGETVEGLLPKLTGLVWFRQAFMPDWFRRALYDRLTRNEAELISKELGEILSAVNPEGQEQLQLRIAIQSAPKDETPKTPGPFRSWVKKIVRKYRIQAMGQVADPRSPMRDFVMLQYLSGRQGKALTPYLPKEALKLIFPEGKPWLGFRPETLLLVSIILATGLWWWQDPIPVPLPSPVQAVAFSSDGNRLAAGLEDGRLIEWDWAQEQVKLTDTGYPGPVTSVALSESGRFLAGGYQDGTIQVLDAEGKKDNQHLKQHDSPVTSMAFWPNPKNIPRFVSVDAKKYVVWNDFTPGKSEGYGYANIRAMAFSQTGGWAAGGHSGGQMFTDGAGSSSLNTFFNLDLSFLLPDKDHGALNSLAWDPTAEFFIAHHADGKLRILDRRSEKVLASIQGPVEDVSGLSWPTPEEVLLGVVGAEGTEVWRLHVPPESLQRIPSDIQKRVEETPGGPIIGNCENMVRGENSQASGELQYQNRGRYFEGMKDMPTAKTGIELVSFVADYREAYSSMPDCFRVRFYLHDETSVNLTIRDLTPRTLYWIDRVIPSVPRVANNWNTFEWPTRPVIQKVFKEEVKLYDLGVLARVGSSEPSSIERVAPAILFHAFIPSSISGYIFTFRHSEVMRANASIIQETTGKALFKRNFRSTNVGDPLNIHWETNGAEAGNYRLELSGFSLESNEPFRIEVRFYHQPNVLAVPSPVDDRQEPGSKISPVNTETVSSVDQSPQAPETSDFQREKEKLTRELTITNSKIRKMEEEAIKRGGKLGERMKKLLRSERIKAKKLMRQLENLQSRLQAPVPPVKHPTKITGKDGASMVLVSEGEFTRGARSDDLEADADEKPSDEIFLNAFYIDQFEVPVSRYFTFLQETKQPPPKYWSNVVTKKYPKKPVVGVTWEEAKSYCEWAGKRLPTEAEWEKAARGTDERLYPWGNQIPNSKLATFNQSGSFNYSVLSQVDSPGAGQSVYGAYHMAGNVWEWVEDWYAHDYYKNSVRQNPKGPNKGEFRILRGGSWTSGAKYLRSTQRVKRVPTDQFFNQGIRCAKDAPLLNNQGVDLVPPPSPTNLRIQ